MSDVWKKSERREVKKMIYCKKCGAKLPEDSIFCQKCRTKQDVFKPKEVLSKKWLWWFLIGCVTIVIVIIILIVNKESSMYPPQVLQPSSIPEPELHLGISYCHIEEVEYPKGPINPATPTGIKAGMQLESKNGICKSVMVKYTVKDPRTKEVIKFDSNYIPQISGVYEDSMQIPLGFDVFFKEEFGDLTYYDPSVDIEVSSVNCKTVGDCSGCTENGVSFFDCGRF